MITVKVNVAGIVLPAVAVTGYGNLMPQFPKPFGKRVVDVALFA